MQVPRLTKVVLNMGVGEASQDRKKVEAAAGDMTLIAGQKPVITRPRSRSPASSCARHADRLQGDATARADVRVPRSPDQHRAAEGAGLPRVSKKSFDGRGNFAMGIKEQIIFPEISYDKVDQIRGLDIIICTTAKTDAEAQALLRAFDMPFAN